MSVGVGDELSPAFYAELLTSREILLSARCFSPAHAARAGPDERRLKLFLALGLVLGGMGGTVVAVVVEAFARPGGNDPAREDFQRTLDGFPFVVRAEEAGGAGVGPRSHGSPRRRQTRKQLT